MDTHYTNSAQSHSRRRKNRDAHASNSHESKNNHERNEEYIMVGIEEEKIGGRPIYLSEYHVVPGIIRTILRIEANPLRRPRCCIRRSRRRLRTTPLLLPHAEGFFPLTADGGGESSSLVLHFQGTRLQCYNSQ